MLVAIRPASGLSPKGSAMNVKDIAFAHRDPTGRSTLICLHSSGGNGRQWDALVPALPATLDVRAPDLLGYGGIARWPAGRPVSLDDEARHLAALLPPTGAHLFGHSYGGAVAMQIALRWPERVASLTLYEPVRFALLARRPESASTFEAIVGVGRRIGLDVISGSLHGAAARFVDYWSGDGTWARIPAHRQQAVAECMPKVQAEFEALFADRVPAAAYAALTMPVHLVGGTRSPLPARQVLDVLAAQMPHATRATVVGAGHMAPVVAPAQVAAHLPAWMTAAVLPAAA